MAINKNATCDAISRICHADSKNKLTILRHDRRALMHRLSSNEAVAADKVRRV
jgi:hypothetical protein